MSFFKTPKESTFAETFLADEVNKPAVICMPRVPILSHSLVATKQLAISANKRFHKFLITSVE
jgi:hypothetical protein